MVIKKNKFLALTAIFLSLCFSCGKANAEFLTDAPSAVLIDAGEGTVLFEKNCHGVRSCASVMKIMNVLLAAQSLENNEIEENENVCVSDEASKATGSNVWLKSGENIPVEDLIKSIAMISANDACLALAEHIEGSEGKFVSKMNEKAAELKMQNTIFKNCTGADEDGNVSTAFDIALMCREIINYKNVFSYFSGWIDHIRNGETQIVNTNRLLKTYGGTTGIKTGTSEKAGSCIAASAEKNGIKLVAVVLGCKDPKERYKETESLFDYGFSEYIKVKPNIPPDLPKTIKVTKGMMPEAKINAELNSSFLMPKQNSAKINYKIDLKEEIEAPVKLNQKIGEITFLDGEKILSTCDIISESQVDAANFETVFKHIAKNFFRL